MTTFSDFGFSAPVLKALSALGIESPTQIQQEAIPALLGGNCDLIGLAQTGTGKTAAFGLPLIEKIDTNRKTVQALVIAPTRELGQQVAGQLEAFGRFKKGLRVVSVYGGQPMNKQLRILRENPQVVVATPGRLLDLLGRRAIDLKQVGTVVLDEADEMLNMGFKQDIDRILSNLPTQRQVWLFSATMPQAIRDIVSSYMNDPLEVKVMQENEVNDNIDHRFLGVRGTEKTEALRQYITRAPEIRAVVFCRTKRETQRLSKDLRGPEIAIDALHGNLTQSQRDKVMNSFRKGRLQVLVATNIAARGIDVSGLTHVIHHSLPDDWADYSHRSGRTARAGQKGISLALVSRNEMRRIRELEHKLKITFSAEEAEGIGEVFDLNDEKPRRNGNKPNRANDRRRNVKNESPAGSRDENSPRGNRQHRRKDNQQAPQGQRSGGNFREEGASAETRGARRPAGRSERRSDHLDGHKSRNSSGNGHEKRHIGQEQSDGWKKTSSSESIAWLEEARREIAENERAIKSRRKERNFNGSSNPSEEKRRPKGEERPYGAQFGRFKKKKRTSRKTR